MVKPSDWIWPLLLAVLACGCSASGDGDGTGGTGAGGTGGGGGPGGDGGTGPLDCPTALAFAPCGGDPTGTWTVALSCAPTTLDAEPSIPACTGLPIAAADLQVDGTVTFTATHVTNAVTREVSFGFELPEACLEAVGGPGANLAVVCQTAGTGPGAPFPELGAACGFDTGGCRCGVTVSDAGGATEAYGIQGTELVVGTGARRRAYPFCVQGDRLFTLEPWGVVTVYAR